MNSATPATGEQFVKDANGKPVAVVLDIATYERLREAEEDLADIRAFDEAWPAAQADLAKGEVISLDDYAKQRATRRKDVSR
jgi:hypothetical protein